MSVAMIAVVVMKLPVETSGVEGKVCGDVVMVGLLDGGR